MIDIIFIAGAPGVGKSTLAKNIHALLKSPLFEFGWIPEFRIKGRIEINYLEEEQLSFENLSLVVKNYTKHGFKNILVTDLEDKRILELDQVFADYNYLIITLTTSSDDELKSRILNKQRQNNYKDFESATRINKNILERPLLKSEVRIDVTNKSIAEVLDNVKAHLKSI